MDLDAKYMTFYLDGRGEEPFDDEDVDLDDLVEKAMGGDSPRKLAIGIGETLAAPLRHDRERREWLADNRDNIREAGGNDQLAFDHYMQGRIDQYAYGLEDEIVTAMFEDVDDGDGDDEDDEDDE